MADFKARRRQCLVRLVSIVVRRDFPLCGRFFIVGVIVGISLLFLFFGKQSHDASPLGFIRSLLKQLAVMFYVLAPDETEQGPVSIGRPRKTLGRS